MQYLFMVVLICFLNISCTFSDEGKYSSFRNQNLFRSDFDLRIYQKLQSIGCNDYNPDDIEPYSKATEERITYLLNKYVKDGNVLYRQWLIEPADIQNLCALVKSFEISNDFEMNSNQKKAFYINAYNILTIHLILFRYYELLGGDDSQTYYLPRKKSIQNLIPKLAGTTWNVFSWRVAGRELTLDEIQKKVLVPMRDARVHFAINCASIGCPPLFKKAFEFDNINEDLEKVTYDFVNSGDQTIFGKAASGSNEIVTSQIMEWYAKDFEADSSGNFKNVREFFVHYLDEKRVNIKNQDLMKKNANGAYLWKIVFDYYDWGLNEAF